MYTQISPSPSGRGEISGGACTVAAFPRAKKVEPGGEKKRADKNQSCKGATGPDAPSSRARIKSTCSPGVRAAGRGGGGLRRGSLHTVTRINYDVITGPAITIAGQDSQTDRISERASLRRSSAPLRPPSFLGLLGFVLLPPARALSFLAGLFPKCGRARHGARAKTKTTRVYASAALFQG